MIRPPPRSTLFPCPTLFRSRLASSLERITEVTAEEADRRLRSVRGIGGWTSAEVRQRALGDPDAVSFGDYHLANWVGWALEIGRAHVRTPVTPIFCMPSSA